MNITKFKKILICSSIVLGIALCCYFAYSYNKTNNNIKLEEEKLLNQKKEREKVENMVKKLENPINLPNNDSNDSSKVPDNNNGNNNIVNNTPKPKSVSPSHSHSYGSRYFYENENTHYLACSCGNKQTSSHTFSTKTLSASTCAVSGIKSLECSKCLAVKTESIPALGHSYGTSTLYKEPTCVYQGENRAYCTKCTGYASTITPAKGAGNHNFINNGYVTCSVLQQTQPLARANLLSCGICGYYRCNGCGRTGPNAPDLHR